MDSLRREKTPRQECCLLLLRHTLGEPDVLRDLSPYVVHELATMAIAVNHIRCVVLLCRTPPAVGPGNDGDASTSSSLPYLGELCSVASWCNSVLSLRFLHEAGHRWTVHTTRAAASHGSIECLRYAHQHGCPWDEVAWKQAATVYEPACLEYAMLNGCPPCDEPDADDGEASPPVCRRHGRDGEGSWRRSATRCYVAIKKEVSCRRGKGKELCEIVESVVVANRPCLEPIYRAFDLGSNGGDPFWKCVMDEARLERERLACVVR